MSFSAEYKDFIVNLPRKSLSFYFKNKESYTPKTQDLSDNLKAEKATFVTITKNSKLRGCMGKIKATQPLYMDIIKNTYNASFNDPRFPSVTKQELANLHFEISILSTPKQLKYTDSSTLCSLLAQSKPGVILESKFNRATYLPQVWKQLETPEKFLSHLCVKAGLPSNYWEENKPSIKIYRVKRLSEPN
jgi:AmmeMemoRadiSam system protein A